MASALATVPRGFSGLIGEKGKFFETEYRWIYAAIEQSKIDVLLRPWKPTPGELTQPDEALKLQIVKYTRNYLAYKAIVDRALNLYQQMHIAVNQCKAYPKLTDKNWAALTLEGDLVDAKKETSRLLHEECIPQLQKLVRTSKQIYEELSRRLKTFGSALNQDFAPAFATIDNHNTSMLWGLVGGVQSRLRTFVDSSAFLDRAIGMVLAPGLETALSARPEIAIHRPPQPVLSIEEENRNLEAVKIQLQTITARLQTTL